MRPAGKRVFGACAACHSLQPGRNMTGPSLAGRVETESRKLGRASAVIPKRSKSANIVWTDKTLDEWIKDPQHVVPGNEHELSRGSKTPGRARTCWRS